MRLRRILRRRSCRPHVEALEGRTLLAFSALDPTFGTGGVFTFATPDGVATEVAAAVQPDGKVVFAESDFASTVGSSIGVRRLDASGNLDPTFGTGGTVSVFPTAAFISLTASNADAPKDVVIQPDGKVLVAAAFTATATDGTVTGETVVARFNANGTADDTFGKGGLVTITSKNALLTSVALQADGKIVVAGSATVPEQTRPVGAATRLDADGSADDTFNGGAIETFDQFPESVVAAAIDPSSGKIVLAGTVETFLFVPVAVAGVIRLDADGTPDATFGTGGFEQTTSHQSVAALAIQSDGKILVAGEGSTLTAGYPALTRLDADGSADPTFNADFTIPSGPRDYRFALTVSSLAIQPDGKILVGGSQPRTSNAAFAVARFDADGSKDATFGIGGEATFNVPAPVIPGLNFKVFATAVAAPALALGTDGTIVVAGNVSYTTDQQPPVITQSVVARLLPIAVTRITAGDYDGDGKADVAAYLPGSAVYADRPSAGGGDVLRLFGATGSIPAPGDYDGDGITDVAVYLPSIGAFGIRPSSGGPDEIIPFGVAGAGGSIPAIGDYDGDGKSDLAVYIPSQAVLAYRPSSGGSDVPVPFGFAGVGGTIPAPGDYDGDGKTDVAAYLPSVGDFAVRYSSVGLDEITPFGIAGAGQSIPVPDDYNGDGYTDIAVYLPSLAVLAYRPSDVYNPVDVLQSFGTAGARATIPAPGDYDGDGKADVAAYLPASGQYAYRPSGGGPDVVEPFGPAGAGATVPASSIPYASAGTVSAASVPNLATAQVLIPLTDDLVATSARTKRDRK